MTSELCLLPAVEQRRLIRAGELSARELLEACLARIEETSPIVNAIVTLDPEGARRAARAADDAQARGEELGVLHGLVMAHKDLLATKGMRTTRGSLLFADHVPDADDHAAARMAAAGAIRVGKTNVPEFGLGSHTVNRVFGPTRNPWDPSRSAGGSSGGAAAALAAGMVSLADGGDQGGSLRNPASFCNVVGLRPSTGRVSRAPLATAWPTLSVLGPMGRTVADAALLYSAMAGFDPADPNSIPTDAAEVLELVDAEPTPSLRGLRVGWTPDLGGLPVDPDVTAVLDGVGRSALAGLGAEIRDWQADFAGAEEAFLVQRAWLVENSLGAAYRSRPEIFGDNVRANLVDALDLTPERLHRAAVLQLAVRARVLAAFDEVDVLAMPTVQLPPFPIEWDWPHEVAGVPQGHYLMWMRSCWYITLTGLPAISIPCGFTPDGLPVGMQLVGRPLGEVDLLRTARALEAAIPATGARPPLPWSPAV